MCGCRELRPVPACSPRALVPEKRKADIISVKTGKASSDDWKPENNIISKLSLRKINLTAVMRLCHFLAFKLQKVA